MVLLGLLVAWKYQHMLLLRCSWQNSPVKGMSKQRVLLNRHIIVGICGGIASYKAVELVSQLQQAGALVDVIMTEHAEDFVRPLTFATMSHRRVYADLWEPSGQAAETHIALAEQAELLAIIPA